MKFDFLYNLKKIANKIEVFKLKKYAIDSNLFLLNQSPVNIKSILLYFPSYEMMHLGDHLFFEPLARFLKLNQYQVFVTPTPAMEFYFRSLDYEIGNDATINKVDLVITRVEFIELLKKTNSQVQVLLFDTTSTKISSPLCVDIVNKAALFLGINGSNYDSRPSYFYKSGNLGFFNQSDSYIVFNNYIDSGKIRSGSGHQDRIVCFVKKLKEQTGFKVIHTGSSNDRSGDLRVYDFVDIDIRGRTSVADLFAICASDNVKYNVSFDGFQMHLCLIQEKKSFVLFRGRILKKNENYIKRYVNPPFAYKKHISQIIEYIE